MLVWYTPEYDKKETKSGEATIINFFECIIPTTEDSVMTPCSTTSQLYQKYLLLASKYENINVEAVLIGASSEKQTNISMLENEITIMTRIKGKWTFIGLINNLYLK